MALQFARGTVQWLAADVATTLYTISGLAFQPKVIRASCVGIKNTADATSAAVDWRCSTGFATGTASRRCVATQDQDAAAAATCTSAAFNDCILATVTSTPARDGALDLDSIQSDGFKFIVDDAAPVDITVLWEAWGGTDIDDAGVGDIAEPAATGDQDYATGGKVASFVFLAGVQSVSAVNTAERNDSGFMMGFTAGASDNAAIVGNSDDGSATMDTDRQASVTECLLMTTVGGGSTSARATCTQLVASTGMRLNWTARATTNRRYIYCWVRGGRWKISSFTVDTTTIGNTTTVSNLLFQPIGLLALVSNPNTGSNTTALLVFGSAASTSDRATLSVRSADGAANAAVDTSVEYAELLTEVASGGAGVDFRIDLDAILSNGYRVIVDKTSGLSALSCFGVAFSSVASLPIFDRPHFYRRKRLR